MVREVLAFTLTIFALATVAFTSAAYADNADDEVIPTVDSARVQSVEMSGGTVSGMSLPASMDSVGAATVVSRRGDRGPSTGEGGLSLYFLTSRTTQDVDYRNMRQMGGGGGSGDGGGGGGGGSDGGSGGGGGGGGTPNLNYVSASAFMPLSNRDTVALNGMQSLDPADHLRIPNPSGPDLQLPSQVAMLRFRHAFSPAWAADVRGFYIDTVGFRDPSLGASYSKLNPGGWTQTYQLSLAAPVTSQSINDNLLTRASLRAQYTKRANRWAFVGGLAHVHAFYDGTPPARGGGRGASGSRDGSTSGRGDDRTIPIYPSDVDLILVQREMQRSRGDVSVAYAVSDDFTVGAGAGLAQATTDKGRVMWLSSAKPLILKYVVNQAEVGADLTLTSDIGDFYRVSLPSFLTVGMRLGYTFGQKPMMN